MVVDAEARDAKITLHCGNNIVMCEPSPLPLLHKQLTSHVVNYVPFLAFKKRGHEICSDICISLGSFYPLCTIKYMKCDVE